MADTQIPMAVGVIDKQRAVVIVHMARTGRFLFSLSFSFLRLFLISSALFFCSMNKVPTSSVAFQGWVVRWGLDINF